MLYLGGTHEAINFIHFDYTFDFIIDGSRFCSYGENRPRFPTNSSAGHRNGKRLNWGRYKFGSLWIYTQIRRQHRQDLTSHWCPAWRLLGKHRQNSRADRSGYWQRCRRNDLWCVYVWGKSRSWWRWRVGDHNIHCPKRRHQCSWFNRCPGDWYQW